MVLVNLVVCVQQVLFRPQSFSAIVVPWDQCCIHVSLYRGRSVLSIFWALWPILHGQSMFWALWACLTWSEHVLGLVGLSYMGKACSGPCGLSYMGRVCSGPCEPVLDG